MSILAKLTEKQADFVEQYLVDLNATQAAIRAGYSLKTANEQAARLLVNVSVRAAIEKAMLKRSKRVDISTDDVLQELWSIATDDLKNYLEFRTEKQVVDKAWDEATESYVSVFGYRTVVEMKDSNAINTKNISEVSVGKDGQFKFKLYSRADALVQVGKHLGMFAERSKIEVTGEGGGPLKHEIDYSKLTLEEMKALRDLLVKAGEA